MDTDYVYSPFVRRWLAEVEQQLDSALGRSLTLDHARALSSLHFRESSLNGAYGLVEYDRGNPIVRLCLPDNLPDDFGRFVIAHEIAHAVLRHANGGAANEREADALAWSWGFRVEESIWRRWGGADRPWPGASQKAPGAAQRGTATAAKATAPATSARAPQTLGEAKARHGAHVYCMKYERRRLVLADKAGNEVAVYPL